MVSDKDIQYANNRVSKYKILLERELTSVRKQFVGQVIRTKFDRPDTRRGLPGIVLDDHRAIIQDVAFGYGGLVFYLNIYHHDAIIGDRDFSAFADCGVMVDYNEITFEGV